MTAKTVLLSFSLVLLLGCVNIQVDDIENSGTYNNTFPSNLAFVFDVELPEERQDLYMDWSDNAYECFSDWGLNVTYSDSPMIDDVGTELKNGANFFYVIAHGTSTCILLTSGGKDLPRCMQPGNIEGWMQNRPPVKFAFLACCYAMEMTDYGTLSDAFRKGELEGTVTIGYAGMGDNTTAAAAAWQESLPWQDSLFQYVSQGYTFYKAFCMANLDHPCVENYVRFVGDESLSLANALFEE